MKQITKAKEISPFPECPRYVECIPVVPLSSLDRTWEPSSLVQCKFTLLKKGEKTANPKSNLKAGNQHGRTMFMTGYKSQHRVLCFLFGSQLRKKKMASCYYIVHILRVKLHFYQGKAVS